MPKTCCSLLLLILGASAQSSKDNFNFNQHEYRVKFEHLDVVSVNERYVNYMNISTFKYNRTCAALNATFMYKVEMGNTFEMILQAYKFMSNEYRLFPLRFQVNICKALKLNMGGIGRFENCGNFAGCPIAKNKRYVVCNMTLDETKFPPLIPTGRYMLKVQALYSNSDLALLEMYLEISRPLIIK